MAITPISYPYDWESDVYYYNVDGLVKYRCRRMDPNSPITAVHNIWKYSYNASGRAYRATGPVLGPATSEAVINAFPEWVF